MDPYDSNNEFLGLTFESEFDAFLSLPANGGGTAAGDSGATSASSYHHQGFGQPGGRDNQCPGCAKYKVDLDRMNHDHKINFQLLKKKIINTDLVLRKLKEQKDECDLSHAETEEFKRKLDQARRDSDILSQQLSSAMGNIKPLEEEKDRLRTQLDLKSRQVIELSDRIEGDRALRLQRTAQDDYNRNLEIEVTKLKKNNSTLNAKNRSLISKVKDLTADKKCLQCSKSVVERRLDNLAVALHEAQEKSEVFWRRLRQHDLAAGEKRPNFILSGFKSLVRRAVDKKNGIFTDQPINYAASDNEEGGARSDNSDWDDSSDAESSDNDVTPQKGVTDDDRPSTSKTDTRFPASNKSAIASQVQQNTRKQVESDTNSSPALKKILHQLPKSSAEIIPQNDLSKLSKHEGSQRVIEDTTCILSHNKRVVSTADHLQKPVESEIAPPKDLKMSLKLSETIKIASEGKKNECGSSISNRSKKDSIASTERKLDQIGKTYLNQKVPETRKLVPEGEKKEHCSSVSDRSMGKSIMSSKLKLDQLDRTNLNKNGKNGAVHSLDDSLSSLSSDDEQKLPETTKLVPEGEKKEHCRSISDRSMEKSIMSSKLKLDQLDRTNLNKNGKNGAVHSLDDSLSSLSSSDDDSDDATYVDELLNFGSACSKDKEQSVDLDTAFSFAEIEDLLSPLSVSPCPVSSLLSPRSKSPLTSRPVSPLLPHPASLLPPQAVTEVSASPHPIGSPVLSLADMDYTDEDDTVADCLFANESDSSNSQSPLRNSQSPLRGDDWEKMASSGKPLLNNVQTGAVKRAKKAKGDGGSQNLTVSRSQSVGFTPVTDETGDFPDVEDKSISDSVSGVSTLADVNISEDVSDAITLTDSCVLESVSIHPTLMDKSDSEHSSNSATVLDHNIAKNICSETADTGRRGTDSLLDMDTCVEVYILKSDALDELSTQSEVKLLMADTCDSKFVIKDTQAPEMEVDLLQIDQLLNAHDLRLKSPLSQTQQSLETQSLGLKSPLSQTQQSLETQSLDLKSPLSQTQQSLEPESLDLNSPSSPLSQTNQTLEIQSLGLKLPLSQTQQSLETQSLDLKSPSPPLPQISQSLEPESLDLNSPSSPLSQTNQTLEIQLLGLKLPLSQTQQSLEMQSLDLNSPSSPLSQTQQPLETQSLDIKSPLSQTQQSLEMQSLDLNSPSSPLSQTQQPLETQSLDLKSPLSQTQQSLDIQSLGLKSPLSQSQQSLETQSLDLKSPSPPLPQINQSLEPESLDLNSPSSPLSQTQQTLERQSLDLKPSLSQTQQSSETQSLDFKSPLSPTNQTLETQSLGLQSPLSQIQQSLETASLDLKSPSTHLSQTNQALETQSVGLKSPLSETRQTLDIHSLALKSPLSQTRQTLDIHTLGLKSPLSQTRQTLDIHSVGLKSPLFQTQQSLDIQSLGLKSPVSQAQQSFETQSLDLKSPSPPLPQISQSLEPDSLDLKSSSPPLSQINQSLEPESLDLNSPSSPLSQTQQTLETQSLDLKPSLSQTQQSSEIESLDLKSPSPFLPQISQSLEPESLDLNSPSSPLSQTIQTLETQSLGLKSPLSQTQQSLDIQSLGLKSPLSQTNQTLEMQSLDLKPSLSQTQQSLERQSLDLKSPSPHMQLINQSLEPESLDLNSPSSSLPQINQSLDTESLDLKSPSTLSSKHQSLNSQDSFIKSPTSFSQMYQSLNSQDLNIKSPSLSQCNKSLNTKAPDMLLSVIPNIHLSLDADILDIKSLSAIPQLEQSIRTTTDIKSPSTVPNMHPSLIATKLSAVKSPSTVPDVYPSLNTTNLSDEESPLTVPDVYPSLNTTNLSDEESPLTVPDVRPSLKTKATDIKPSPTVSQVHHPLNTKASDIMSPTTSHIHPPLELETVDTNSSTVSQVHHSTNTEASDIKSTAVPKSLKTSDIKISSAVQQQPNTKASHIKSAETVAQVQQSLKTNISDDKSSAAVSEVHQPLNTKESKILRSTIPGIHPSLDTESFDIGSSSTFHESSIQDSDITPPSAEHQRYQPANTKASSVVPQIHPSLDTEISDIKSSSGVLQTSINNSDITPSSAELQMDQPPNTKAANIKSPPVPQVHKSLRTRASSTTLHINSSLDTETLDIQSLSTQDSDVTSSSVMPRMHQPRKTKASDIKASSPVPQVRQSLRRKASSSVPHIHPSLDTQTLDIKASSPVTQVHQGPKRKTSDIKASSPVTQVHQAPKRKTSDIKASSPVTQVHQASKRKASSAIPHSHLSLDTQTADIKSSSAVHQSLGTQDSDIKSPSVSPQRTQSLLQDIFNFFTLPPPLSPLPPSPPPRKQNKDMTTKFKTAAPENVPKVTPCAQVKKQTTVGNTSSMTAQIMEARKLLAKRKAAALVKSTAVTNGAERKRSAALAGISPAGPTKRRKLANLSGFPNANAAVLYDLRQFLTAKDLDLKMAAETMLSRVVEGNTKAAWEALCQATISYLDSTNQDVLSHLISACENEEVIDTVFIREEERRLVLLISAFWRLDESLDRRQLMGKIWTAIFNRGCSNQLVRLSYCIAAIFAPSADTSAFFEAFLFQISLTSRMFTSLCLEQGDIEQARILVYSIAWCDYIDLVHPLMAIVGVWPQVLADKHCKVSKRCIWNVLGFMVKEKCKTDISLLQKVTLVIQKVCQFNLDKIEESADKLLKSLLQQLLKKCEIINNCATEDNTFDIMKTIELLLVYQGPEWTERHFIHSNLVSLSMKRAIKKADTTELSDLYITCLIRVFRAVIAVQTPSSGTVGAVLGSVFPLFLRTTATGSDMMFTCIDTLLELAPHNLKKSLDVLNKWKATQSNIPAETESKLQEVQSLLPKTPPQKSQYKARKHKKPK